MQRMGLHIFTSDSGIYFLLNICNERIYIGQAQRIRERIASHIHTLNRNVHSNQALQNDWNTYGPYAFEAGVLTTVHRDGHMRMHEGAYRRRCVEDIFIRAYQSNDPRYGYNLRHAFVTNTAHRFFNRAA